MSAEASTNKVSVLTVKSEEDVIAPKATSPALPLNTSEELDASAIKVNLPALSSKPKKPTLAAEPLWYLNSIPLSLLSSEAGAVSPPHDRDWETYFYSRCI